MKIFAVGRNYIEHAKRLNNAVPDTPVVFMKPETALLKTNEPFYYPDFSSNIHYECELVIKICKNGKNIQEEFAHKYYDQITVGIDFTARDIQDQCKEKGLPWELAKSFDNSAVAGEFIDIKDIPDRNNINFSLKKDGQLVQKGNSKDMIFNIDHIISYISGYFTFKIGDLLYTGTPAGVGSIKPGDIYEGYIEDKKLFAVEIK